MGDLSKEYEDGLITGAMIMDILHSEIPRPNCKYCGSNKQVVRFGSYKGVQRWWCKKCRRKFTASDALPKMKTPVSHIASALSLYYGGMSLNAIRRHMTQQYGYAPSESTLYDWLTRFSELAVKEAKKHKPDVGDVWVADETVLKIGGKNVWFWDIIDAKTRFLLASHLSTSRNQYDARLLMHRAAMRASKPPKTIITDQLAAYLEGVAWNFGRQTRHIAAKDLRATPGTQLIERFHSSLKTRTKVMRGLKKIETAKLLMDGWLVHYNFFRPHESLGDKTPADKAGIVFPFDDWMDVTRLSMPNMAISQTKKPSPAGKPSLRITPQMPPITPRKRGKLLP